MKKFVQVLVIFAAFALFLTATPAFAQGTAFTYQGQLQNNHSPASGTYTLTFSLFNTSTGGAAVIGPVTNTAVFVTNGLFTVLIDFGPVAFTGATNWLEIGVETNGSNSFTTLTPRQQLTPTPYAIYAEGANAAGLNGIIPMANLSGTYGAAVNLTNAGNSFSGNGGGLTNIAVGKLNWSAFTIASFTNNVAGRIPVLVANGVTYYLTLSTNGP